MIGDLKCLVCGSKREVKFLPDVANMKIVCTNKECKSHKGGKARFYVDKDGKCKSEVID